MKTPKLQIPLAMSMSFLFRFISLIIDFLGDANPRNKRSFNSYPKVQVCILLLSGTRSGPTIQFGAVREVRFFFAKRYGC